MMEKGKIETQKEIEDKLPEIVDTTEGKIDAKQRFAHIPGAAPVCGQATLWGWVSTYGRNCVMQVFVKGCKACPEKTSCQRLKSLYKIMQEYRDNHPVASRKDSDVLSQLSEFMKANRKRLELEKQLAFAVSRGNKESQEDWINTRQAVEIIGNEYYFHKIQREGLVSGERQGREIFYKRSDINTVAEMLKKELNASQVRMGEKQIRTTINYKGTDYITRRMVRELLDLTSTMRKYYIDQKRLKLEPVETDGLQFNAVTLESVVGLFRSWPVRHQERVSENIRKNYPEFMSAFGIEPEETEVPVPTTAETVQPETEIPEEISDISEIPQDHIMELQELDNVFSAASAYLELKSKMPAGIFSGKVPTIREDLDIAYEDLINQKTEISKESIDMFMKLLCALEISGCENPEVLKSQIEKEVKEYLVSKSREPRGLFSGTPRSIISDLDLNFEKLAAGNPDKSLCRRVLVIMLAWQSELNA